MRQGGFNPVSTPGRGTVYAKFRISEEQVAEIRAALEDESKIEREFFVGVKDQDGELIAEVKKLLHFRKKENGATTRQSQAEASR